MLLMYFPRWWDYYLKRVGSQFPRLNSTTHASCRSAHPVCTCSILHTHGPNTQRGFMLSGGERTGTKHRNPTRYLGKYMKSGTDLLKVWSCQSFAETAILYYKIKYVNSLFELWYLPCIAPPHQNHDRHWWQSPTLLGCFVLTVAHSEHVYIPIPFILLGYFQFLVC